MMQPSGRSSLSALKGGEKCSIQILAFGILGLSQLSEKTRTSYADASPSIRSSFGTMLWIFKCIILKCLERYSNELDEQLETEPILPSTESGPGFGCTSPHNKKDK